MGPDLLAGHRAGQDEVAVAPATAAPAALPAFMADQLLVGYAAGASADSRESARAAVSPLSAEALVAAAPDRRSRTPSATGR